MEHERHKSIPISAWYVDPERQETGEVEEGGQK
jgi:hypothetical protein